MSNAGDIEVAMANIARMNDVSQGYDAIILCTSSSLHAAYWQDRLDRMKGLIIKKDTIVLAVDEDWPGGAGNALGTLYAYEKACKLALSKGFDVKSKLNNNEISVALYHTAGKGTRLAPLPAGENNNKPGVKLAATIPGSNDPISILESVIKQTGCYAKSRVGRLSVYWGDQVFIPTVQIDYVPTNHVDILCSLGPMISAEEWKAKGMEKYGLIATRSDGSSAQIEKVDHKTACELLTTNIEKVGTSLGSFSVSNTILEVLMEEFSVELANKAGKFDSDPHLWMPMTLQRDAYIFIMKQKKTSEEESGRHYDRIKDMITRNSDRLASYSLFGPVDVGGSVLWWDYGQLKLFQFNNLKFVENNSEGDLIRQFFQVRTANYTENDLIIENSTGVDSCNIISGKVKSSTLCNVRCESIDCENAILVNVTARRIVAPPGSIIYNITDVSEEGLVVPPEHVLVGMYSIDNDGNAVQTPIHSSLNIDGGKSWEEVISFEVNGKVYANSLSFDQLHIRNMDADPKSIESASARHHDITAGQVSPSKSPKKN